MSSPLRLGRFSIGIGDRFARQAQAQLQALVEIGRLGVPVTPVWNKSNREHTIIGSEPASTRAAADAAVAALGWQGGHFLDADHIRLETVGRFLGPCDFFTIDVADSIGQASPSADVEAFVARHPELVGEVRIAGIPEPFQIGRSLIEAVSAKYLAATAEAGRIHRHILASKGEGSFVTEVSMDETDLPQTPPELLVILAALADEKVPVQTIAPKFTGRFNKGVDYVGDVSQFEREFNDDLAVIAHAVARYGLPSDLKLSVHSGSDKFSIYGPIRRALQRTGAGVHLKTAGTTWLEEVIGLAEAGGDGLELAKEIYREALAHREALCAPYATVIDIDPDRLPTVSEVDDWSSARYVAALRHVPSDPGFNPSFRQLIHVGFKVAAKMGPRYLSCLERHREVVSRNVTGNLLERHLKPLLVG